MARRRGRQHSWRFRVPQEGFVAVQDQIQGRYAQDLGRETGDFVVRRTDGLFAYQLAVVVDDGEMGVTDVVRGADLLASTPRQVALFEALGYPIPRFWHVPLMRDETGARMSKRDGSASLAEIRQRGQQGPEEVVGRLAASLGLVDTGAALSALELAERLASPERLQRALQTVAGGGGAA